MSSDSAAFLGLFGIAILFLIHGLIVIPRKNKRKEAKEMNMTKKHKYTVIGTGSVIDGRLEVDQLSSKMADLSALHNKSSVLVISTDEDIPEVELGTKFHLDIAKDKQ